MLLMVVGLISFSSLHSLITVMTFKSGRVLRISYENGDNSLVLVGSDDKVVILDEKELKNKAGLSGREIIKKIENGEITYSDATDESFWSCKLGIEKEVDTPFFDGELFDVKKKKTVKQPVESYFRRERDVKIGSEYFVREANESEKNDNQFYIVRSMPSLQQKGFTCYFHSIFNSLSGVLDKQFDNCADRRKCFEKFYELAKKKINKDSEIDSLLAEKLISEWLALSNDSNFFHINCTVKNDFVDHGLCSISQKLINAYIKNNTIYIVLNSLNFKNTETVNSTSFSWKAGAYGEIVSAHAVFIKVVPATKEKPLTIEVSDSFCGKDNRYARLIHKLATIFLPELSEFSLKLKIRNDNKKQ